MSDVLERTRESWVVSVAQSIENRNAGIILRLVENGFTEDQIMDLYMDAMSRITVAMLRETVQHVIKSFESNQK